ncbi:hypothetical protein O1611_g1636 [Lasiodiplodia mahajangana]|uniref:Uncharacterized protein n=1 Tax=Lasiodiplodia mahajangana TaxID=1108764 RepID=A0ACC2JWU9_9PEZI|nr:hypothetical protein O1611_g1636 [Lasiodiplodia mahajangana]
MTILQLKPTPRDPEPAAEKTVPQADESVPLSTVTPGHVEDPVAAFDKTPSDAIAAGIEADILGFEEITLDGIHRKILKLNRRGCQLKALRHALDHACRWAFITGYKRRFDARVGLLPAVPGRPQYLAIFFSFDLPPASHIVDLENRSVTGSESWVVNPSGLAQQETKSAAQPENKMETKGMSLATKHWVAERILRLLLRIYRDITFPKRIWFMEDWGAGKPAFLLMPYSMGARGWGRLQRGTDKAYNRIITQLNDFTGPDDLSNEEEEEEQDEDAKKKAKTTLDYEDMDMPDEDEEVDMVEEDEY